MRFLILLAVLLCLPTVVALCHEFPCGSGSCPPKPYRKSTCSATPAGSSSTCECRQLQPCQPVRNTARVVLNTPDRLAKRAENLRLQLELIEKKIKLLELFGQAAGGLAK